MEVGRQDLGRGGREVGDEGQDGGQEPRAWSQVWGLGWLELGAWASGIPQGPEKGQRKAREGPGSGWAGGGSGLQGHRAVLIQRHRSDGMRAINYCDKMQSWPAHCRRSGSISVPSPTPGPMPRPQPARMLLPTSLSIPPTTHASTDSRVGLQP